MASIERPVERCADEPGRLAALRRYDILDTPPDGAFDRVTRLAARLLDTPIAIVSIVDEDRIWFKAKYGLDVAEVDRAPGLCASAILHDDPWIVEDARRDPRALANPLVAGTFGLQFYAGVPLHTHDGHNLGTLCVIDRQPRQVGNEDQQLLVDLAAIVIDELELRLAARSVSTAADDLREMARVRQQHALQLNDDVVQSLAVAKLAHDTGAAVHAALSAAKQLLSEMGDEAGTLRRSSGAGT